MTTITYVSPKNMKELSTLISEAIESANTMKAKVQITAVAILMHAEKHGDYTGANALVFGLGDGVNTAALVEFFIKFGGLTVGDNPKDGFVGWQKAEYIRENFEMAKKTMWWTFKKVNPFAGFDIASEAERLIKKADKMIATRRKAELEGDMDTVNLIKVNDEQYKLLMALRDLPTGIVAVEPKNDDNLKATKENIKAVAKVREAKPELDLKQAVDVVKAEQAVVEVVAELGGEENILDNIGEKKEVVNA